MCSLGYIFKVSAALHDFMPGELNEHFSNIVISSTENPAEALNRIAKASPEDFCLSELTENDVLLAVSHAESQAKGENGIPQRFIAKAPL